MSMSIGRPLRFGAATVASVIVFSVGLHLAQKYGWAVGMIVGGALGSGGFGVALIASTYNYLNQDKLLAAAHKRMDEGNHTGILSNSSHGKTKKQGAEW